MPYEWNNILVVTKDELVPNWYSWHNLRTTIERYKDKDFGIKRVQLGGNGRVMLIDFDSLPTHIQYGIGDPRLIKHVFETYYKTDREAVKFYKTHQLPDGNYLDIEFQDRYITNASVLKAVLSFRLDIEKERRKKGINTTGITSALCEHAKTFNKTLKVKHKQEHTLPESEKRFKQVLKDFETKGYVSLISGKIGNDNSRKVNDETIALLESMFAKDTTKPTATEVYRDYKAFIEGIKEVVNNETGECYEPDNFKALSDSTVKLYLSRWESKIATHALRSGDRLRYMQNFKFYHSLDKPHFAGSLISIDDRNPPFKNYSGERIWFYNAIDLASEAFTCWVYGLTKEGIILDFYRELVRKYAYWGVCLPDGLEAESALNSNFTNSFLREGSLFENVRIEANNARGKRIEAYYRPLRYQLEKKREGWLARPFAISESNQSGSHKVPLLSNEAIVEGCLRDIETWNNMPHSVHKHLSRWEVFLQMQNPNLKPTDYKKFLFELGYKTTTSCKVGILKLQSGEYLLGDNGEIYTGEKLVALYKKIEGRNIDVYWLDDVHGKVLKALIYIGTQLICEALPKPSYNRAKIEQSEQDIKNREILIKYGSTIESYGKHRQKTIEAVTIIDNSPAPIKSFVMPGLKQRIAIQDDYETQIMPEITTDDFIKLPERSHFKSLKDDF